MVLHCGGRHGPQLWTGAQVKRGRRGLILPPHAIGVALRAARQMLEGSVGTGLCMVREAAAPSILAAQATASSAALYSPSSRLPLVKPQ